MKILNINCSLSSAKAKQLALTAVTLLSCVETRPSKQRNGVSINEYGTVRLCNDQVIKFRDAWVNGAKDRVEQKNMLKKCVRKNQGRLAREVLQKFNSGHERTVVFVEDTHIFGVDNFSDGATQDDFELELSKYEELIRSALDAGIVVYRE